MSVLKPLLFLSALLLASCSKAGIEIKSDYCTYASPVYVGTGDVFTDETARQILLGNETWKAMCPVEENRG